MLSINVSKRQKQALTENACYGRDKTNEDLKADRSVHSLLDNPKVAAF